MYTYLTKGIQVFEIDSKYISSILVLSSAKRRAQNDNILKQQPRGRKEKLGDV